MSYLQLSGRCKLFEDIAERTWAHVLRNHAVKSEVSEVGMTNDIVAEIRTAYSQNRNIGVWANNGWREIDHGSDIDIFVEVRTGEFVWWALQAKVLKLAGHYDVMKPAGQEQQWSKLERLAQQAGCEVRYLLYNGVASDTYSEMDACGRAFTQEQFGCSLVLPSKMAQIANAGTPTFTDFHPVHAQPWRTITCCHANPQRQGITIYSLAQVKDSLKYYQGVAGNTSLPETLQADSADQPVGKVNDLPVDIISRRSEEVERVPSHRMVVRTTTSLNQENESTIQ